MLANTKNSKSTRPSRHHLKTKRDCRLRSEEQKTCDPGVGRSTSGCMTQLAPVSLFFRAGQHSCRPLMTRRVRTSRSRGSPCAGCGGYAGSWGPGAWALARPDWGGQAGCSWEAAPGCRAGTRPSPVQTFSRCDGSRNLITTKSAGPVRELRSILCDPFQTLASLAGPLKRRPSRP